MSRPCQASTGSPTTPRGKILREVAAVETDGDAAAELRAVVRQHPEAARRVADQRDDAIRDRLLSVLADVDADAGGPDHAQEAE